MSLQGAITPAHSHTHIQCSVPGALPHAGNSMRGHAAAGIIQGEAAKAGEFGEAETTEGPTPAYHQETLGEYGRLSIIPGSHSTGYAAYGVRT